MLGVGVSTGSFRGQLTGHINMFWFKQFKQTQLPCYPAIHPTFSGTLGGFLMIDSLQHAPKNLADAIGWGNGIEWDRLKHT